jgi:hypothetical protein
MNHLIIGETCLLKYQLTRVGIKKDPTDIFDDMMVNLDGVRNIIQHNFEDMLSPENIKNVNYLYYPDHGICHNKPINIKYTTNDNDLYSWDVCSFFHFDVQTQESFNSLIRKLKRTKQKFESSEPLTLYYYYRKHKKQDIARLKKKIESFLDFVRRKYSKQIKIVLVTQDEGDADFLNIEQDTDDFYHGHFTTTSSWVGIDENWDAHLNNDLFDLFLGEGLPEL